LPCLRRNVIKAVRRSAAGMRLRGALTCRQEAIPAGGAAASDRTRHQGREPAQRQIEPVVSILRRHPVLKCGIDSRGQPLGGAEYAVIALSHVGGEYAVLDWTAPPWWVSGFRPGNHPQNAPGRPFGPDPILPAL
jgi:hypothetical protein